MGERERERGRAELEPARVGSGQARQGKARQERQARQAGRQRVGLRVSRGGGGRKEGERNAKAREEGKRSGGEGEEQPCGFTVSL